MGGSTSKRHRKRSYPMKVTELVDVLSYGEELGEEEYEVVSHCCGREYRTKHWRKIYWEGNFLGYCQQVKTEFKWAVQLINLVEYNVRSKAPYLHEVNALKTLVPALTALQKEEKIESRQLQEFKLILKRSVLLSAGQTSKLLRQAHSKGGGELSMSMSSSSQINHNHSKISFKRFSKRLSNNSRSQRSIRGVSGFSFTSYNGEFRKSIMNFVDDTLSSMFGNEREITREAAGQLRVFMEFSVILEKHLHDSGCMLGLITRTFVLHIKDRYENPRQAVMRIDQLVDGINQFLSILKEAVIDFYNLSSFADSSCPDNHLIANPQNILSLCTSILFKEKVLYDIVWNALVQQNFQNHRQLVRICEKLSNNTAGQFFIKDRFSLSKETIENATKIEELSEYRELTSPYEQCQRVLSELSKARTPISKMKVILACSQQMNKQIQDFYSVNKLSREKVILDADQVLAIFCYIVVKSKVPHLHAHLRFLDHFATNAQIISIFGYYLSVLNCALEQLQNQHQMA